jgi:hypothetical protein
MARHAARKSPAHLPLSQRHSARTAQRQPVCQDRVREASATRTASGFEEDFAQSSR